MVRITIDEALKEQLLTAGGVVELCDESGAVIARVEPDPRASADGLAEFPELTRDEIERRCNSSDGGLSTDQVKQRLRGLGSP